MKTNESMQNSDSKFQNEAKGQSGVPEQFYSIFYAIYNYYITTKIEWVLEINFHLKMLVLEGIVFMLPLT